MTFWHWHVTCLAVGAVPGQVGGQDAFSARSVPCMRRGEPRVVKGVELVDIISGSRRARVQKFFLKLVSAPSVNFWTRDLLDSRLDTRASMDAKQAFLRAEREKIRMDGAVRGNFDLPAEWVAREAETRWVDHKAHHVPVANVLRDAPRLLLREFVFTRDLSCSEKNENRFKFETLKEEPTKDVFVYVYTGSFAANEIIKFDTQLSSQDEQNNGFKYIGEMQEERKAGDRSTTVECHVYSLSSASAASTSTSTDDEKKPVIADKKRDRDDSDADVTRMKKRLLDKCKLGTLKAICNDLDLLVSGKKQFLPDRIMAEVEDDDDDDE